MTFYVCNGDYFAVRDDDGFAPCESCHIVTRADYLDNAVAAYARACDEAGAEMHRRFKDAGL